MPPANPIVQRLLASPGFYLIGSTTKKDWAAILLVNGQGKPIICPPCDPINPMVLADPSLHFEGPYWPTPTPIVDPAAPLPGQPKPVPLVDKPNPGALVVIQCLNQLNFLTRALEDAIKVHKPGGEVYLTTERVEKWQSVLKEAETFVSSFNGQ